MWSTLRLVARPLPLPSPPYFTARLSWKLGLLDHRTLYSTATDKHVNSSSSGDHSNESSMFLNLQEVEQVLKDVRAGDINVVSVGHRCGWADYMVFASGRSPWHVRNIAQALVYKTKQKQKQKGAQHLFLPSMEGQESGRWIIIDSGPIIVHALDENARAYYSMESMWTSKASPDALEKICWRAIVLVSPDIHIAFTIKKK